MMPQPHMNTGVAAEAGDGARTHDPQLGKLMLYQLSYTRVTWILARVQEVSTQLPAIRGRGGRASKHEP